MTVPKEQNKKALFDISNDVFFFLGDAGNDIEKKNVSIFQVNVFNDR